MATRSKTLGLHEWSKEDNIVAYYYSKYGTYGLYLRDENSLAKWIGSSLGSLKMQAANFRALMGQVGHTLSDYSKLQSEVYNEYGNMSKIELMKLVKKIIDQDTYERNELLKKMGKDPKKMIRV
jgi:hypothetical protein